MAIEGISEEARAYLSGMNPRKISKQTPAPATYTKRLDQKGETPTSALDDDPMGCLLYTSPSPRD